MLTMRFFINFFAQLQKLMGYFYGFCCTFGLVVHCAFLQQGELRAMRFCVS